ncbi:hypothetical protein ACP4OV_022761 [Aristida adscensionis]
MAQGRWMPDHVLLHGDGIPGSYFWNGTTAHGTNSVGCPIHITLHCHQRPLLATILFVECFSAVEPPRVVCAVDDLILLRVLLRTPTRRVTLNDYDYFVYCANKRAPSLQLLERPHPFFTDDDVGLLRRGVNLYTIAALISTSKYGVYDLHRFDSGAGEWSHTTVSLVAPQDPVPLAFPLAAGAERLFYHLITSTVLAIGGEGGTMAWVDLWHGILLCDVLHDQPTLRGVPVPLPMEMLGHGIDFCCPKPLRGITFINGKPGLEPCLRLVHLDADAVPIPLRSYEDASPDWAMRDWEVSIWSNHKMSNSYDDWQMDCKVKASETSIRDKLKTKMLNAGLLSAGAAGAQPQRAFQNLLVSYPVLGIDEDVVYLQARVRYKDPKAFVVAIDTKNNTLLGAVEFATETERGAGIVYFPSTINRFINPDDRVLPITKVDEDDPESSQGEGTEHLKLFELVIKFPSLEESLNDGFASIKLPSLEDESLNDGNST